MSESLSRAALDQLFTEARTFSYFQDRPVSEAVLRELYDLVRLGPTAVNSGPARFVFVTSKEAKERLKPALSSGNLEKTLAAPVTVIVASDPKFYDHLPKLFPHADARAWYSNNEPLAAENALRNSSLQGAYLILAARALGLDAGPMSGFDAAKVDQEFFAENGWKSNFLINLGYGDSSKLHARLPRFSFEEASQIL